MKKEKLIDQNTIKLYLKKLYPICRSITGNGFRRSLKILSEKIDIRIFKFKTGSRVLDWKIPKEWNIKDGYILDPSGKKIVNFKKHTLHVVNYSEPVNKKIDLNDLKKRLFFLKEIPNAIPYVTSYYKRFWGFCLSYKQYLKLKKGKYSVVIKSSLKNGYLEYSDKILKGKSKKQILFSSYLCHPQMANHELSGPLAMMVIYDYLKKTGPHYYSYRFLICPENIGSAAFLSKNKKDIKNKILAGYILNFLANGQKFTYKKSRLGNSISDKAAINVIKNNTKNYMINDFTPEGSDERQFCSPGFNLPIGVISRNDYNYFKEYHTSLDNLSKFNFKVFYDSIEKIIQIITTIEINAKPKSTVLYGTHQFSRRGSNLYDKIFYKRKKEETTKILLEILNLSEGKLDLLDIANKKNFSLYKNSELIENIVKEKLIKLKK
jgi:aminopeptidase-like protein